MDEACWEASLATGCVQWSSGLPKSPSCHRRVGKFGRPETGAPPAAASGESPYRCQPRCNGNTSTEECHGLESVAILYASVAEALKPCCSAAKATAQRQNKSSRD